MRAYRAATRKFPGPRCKAEGFRCQRTNRADVDHVARQLGLHRTTDEGRDLGMLAPVQHAQFHDAADFLTKTHTARAVDAPRHFFGGNEWSHGLMEHHTLLFLVARGRSPVPHRKVLQLTLTALITDRAIERVID